MVKQSLPSRKLEMKPPRKAQSVRERGACLLVAQASCRRSSLALATSKSPAGRRRYENPALYGEAHKLGLTDQALRIGLVIKSTKGFLKRSWSTSSRTFTNPAEGGGPR